MEAEDKYKSELRKGLICDKEILLTPRRRRQLSKESTAPEGLKPTHQKPDSQKLPDLEEHACNTNIPEAKARRFQVPGQHGLHSEFEASPCYIGKACLKKKKKREKKR